MERIFLFVLVIFFFKDGILLAEIAVEAEKDKLELKLFSVYRGTRKTVS